MYVLMFLNSIGKSHILGIYACFFKAMKRRGKIIAVGFMCDASFLGVMLG